MYAYVTVIAGEEDEIGIVSAAVKGDGVDEHVMHYCTVTLGLALGLWMKKRAVQINFFTFSTLLMLLHVLLFLIYGKSVT